MPCLRICKSGVMVILTHWVCQSEEGGDAMSKEASARQLAELVASLREEKEVGWMSEKRVFRTIF